MRVAPALDRVASHVLVGQLVRHLKEARALDLLGVTPARLAALLGGRGRLTDRQLDRVTAATGRPWPLWVLDAGAGTTDPVIAAGPIRQALESSAVGYRQRSEAALAAAPSDRGPGRRPAPRRSRPKPAA